MHEATGACLGNVAVIACDVDARTCQVGGEQVPTDIEQGNMTGGGPRMDKAFSTDGVDLTTCLVYKKEDGIHQRPHYEQYTSYLVSTWRHL